MNHSLLFTLLCLLASAHALNEDDTKVVQQLRREYRTELWKFLGDNNFIQPLKKLHDDFLACKKSADYTSKAILDLLPTFYPAGSVIEPFGYVNPHKYRNLRGLAAMLVLIDSMREAQPCK